MFSYIFSGDFPRSRLLTIILIVIFTGLILTPWLFPGSRPMETAMRISVFIVLVASYDLLIGYTGIVSFAHTMFFGIGAYGVAITLNEMGRGYDAIFIGTVIGFITAVVIAFFIGLFSLRVKAIFFAMVTLAVASAFTLLLSQLYQYTGGEDGLTYSIPRELSPAFKLVNGKVMGVKINGKLILYYAILFSSVALFFFMLRVVNSPFGRVLQAIRENEFRAEAIGYRTVIYRTATNCLAAGVAALAGSLMAIWLKYTGPDTTLSLSIMMDILLMVVIGGMGTLYGAVIGSTIFIMAQNYLQGAMQIASEQLESMGLPLLPELVHPDRWLLWFGILFILSVYFFPTGIVGRLRKAKA
jgi:branched-chain amino acid transport system permease protein